ncbi:MAG: hypothetical protein MZV64_43170 [Ignavibacteriales bacterium]|nr:hypothetical protein [Ignavibacteriales bacterium]
MDAADGAEKAHWRTVLDRDDREEVANSRDLHGACRHRASSSWPPPTSASRRSCTAAT